MVYNEIKFVMAENLSPELLAKSPKKEGLVAVKTKQTATGGFEHDIDAVDNPTDYIKDLAKKENIDMDKLFAKFHD